MTEAQARVQGFTIPVVAFGARAALELLCQPDTRYGQAFPAFDRTKGEVATVDGEQVETFQFTGVEPLFEVTDAGRDYLAASGAREEGRA